MNISISVNKQYIGIFCCVYCCRMSVLQRALMQIQEMEMKNLLQEANAKSSVDETKRTSRAGLCTIL